jgi:hypothetical protein
LKFSEHTEKVQQRALSPTYRRFLFDPGIDLNLAGTQSHRELFPANTMHGENSLEKLDFLFFIRGSTRYGNVPYSKTVPSLQNAHPIFEEMCHA